MDKAMITSGEYLAITLRVNSLIMSAQAHDSEAVEEGWKKLISHLVHTVGIEQ